MLQAGLNIFYLIAFFAVVIAFAYTCYLYLWVKKQDQKNIRIGEIGVLIRNGANTFMRKEYIVLAKFALIMGVLIAVILPTPIWSSNIWDNVIMMLSYFCGTVFSAIAGKIGIFVSTLANTRSAEAALKGIKQSFLIGFRGGSVMGLAVVGTSLLGVAAVLLVTKNTTALDSHLEPVRLLCLLKPEEEYLRRLLM